MSRNILLPETIADIWPSLHRYPNAAIMAGGTDLLPRIRAGTISPETIICLEKIEPLSDVRDEGEYISIGASITHQQIIDNKVVSDEFPLLIDALRKLGSPHIRHMATIGGNICTASPGGDSLPPLYAYGADLEISSECGKRMVKLSEFITGPGKTSLAVGEILTSIRLKKDRRWNIRLFEKVGQRKCLAIVIVSMAALVDVSPKGMISDIRIAWGSVAPTIVVSRKIEEMLIGKKLCADTFASISLLVEEAVSPISDIRATSEYRRKVAAKLLMRLTCQNPHRLLSEAQVRSY